MALVGELAAIIERRWKSRTITTKQGATLVSPLVFHGGEGYGKHQGEAAPVLDFDKAFKSACEEVGIPYGRKAGRTFHCFRRTAARNLRNAGIPENVCMAITGHRTRSMFDRYSIVNENDTADAMVKLQAHVQAQPVETKVVALRRAISIPLSLRYLNGAPGRNRTCGLWLRRPTLYPTELRAQRATHILLLG